MFTFSRGAALPSRIYLDHAASTPTHPDVAKAMLPYLTGHYGNPSAIHAEGRETRAVIEEARSTIATLHGVKPAGVTFTSGGTEANNLAVVGYLKKLHSSGRAYETMEVLTTALEHPSVSETAAHLQELGVVVKTVAADLEGRIVLKDLQSVLSPQTVLCTFAYVNSEIGVVQKVHAIARAIRAYEEAAIGGKIAVHVDAAQAPLWLPCDLPRLDADLITFDGAKCGGPKGIGVLVARKAGSVDPILFGGGQESGLRPGTENVSGIVGLSLALTIAQSGWEQRAVKVAAVRDEALQALSTILPSALLNGPTGEARIANNINISIPGLDTEYAVVVLDQAGIAVSTKSACAGAGSGESAVVKTITGDSARARSTLRITISEETKLEDITRTLTILAKHAAMMVTLTK